MSTATYHYDLRTVFDDLLTMMLCSFSHNPWTGKSYNEDLYLETIGKYKKDDFRFQFPKMLGQLIIEMEDRLSDSQGNDVLGDYFEQHLSRNNSGQFFTPWHVCMFMAECMAGDAKKSEKPLRVLDPSCGSGRMLLAGSRSFGQQHEFYGIDIDHTCVKMAAINLFLNGVFHSEVMWANALMPDDFHMAYRISFLPFGIFRIEDKEKSKLWHMYRNSFPVKEKVVKPEIILPSQNGGMQGETVSQITLF